MKSHRKGGPSPWGLSCLAQPKPRSSSIPGQLSVLDQTCWATGLALQLSCNGAPGPWAGVAWGPRWGRSGHLGHSVPGQNRHDHAACSYVSMELKPTYLGEDSCSGPRSVWQHVPNTLLQQHLKASERNVSIVFNHVFVQKVTTKQCAMLMR